MSVPLLHDRRIGMLTDHRRISAARLDGLARSKRVVVLLGALVCAFALSGCRSAALDQASVQGGCGEAVGARAEALAAVEQATQQAVTRNQARAAQLQGIAKEAAKQIAAAVDLAPCDDDNAATGTVVDLADLRARYGVIRERTHAQLDAVASQPAPARDDTKGNKGKGTRGD